MDASSVVALIIAVISAIAALASAWYARRTSRIERLEDADRVALRFREPLLQAAFNLQSRLYNIVRGDLLHRIDIDLGTAEEQEYVVEYTLYLIGQYFCWVEILRRESLFLDPRNQDRNRAVADQLERVRDAFAASDDPAITGPLRVFRGEQRAIAEMMIMAAEPPSLDAPRWDCIGYARFVKGRSDPDDDRWFRRARTDLQTIRSSTTPDFDRITVVQHRLLELVNVLDPEGHRVPMTTRKSLQSGRESSPGRVTSDPER